MLVIAVVSVVVRAVFSVVLIAVVSTVVSAAVINLPFGRPSVAREDVE